VWVRKSVVRGLRREKKKKKLGETYVVLRKTKNKQTMDGPSEKEEVRQAKNLIEKRRQPLEQTACEGVTKEWGVP